MRLRLHGNECMRFRFSLRYLFIVTTLVGFGCGGVYWHYHYIPKRISVGSGVTGWTTPGYNHDHWEFACREVSRRSIVESLLAHRPDGFQLTIGPGIETDDKYDSHRTARTWLELLYGVADDIDVTIEKADDGRGWVMRKKKTSPPRYGLSVN